MQRHREYEISIHSDVLLLQHHWIEFGKYWGDVMHQAQWTTLCCDRLSVSLKRSAVVSLFRKFCNTSQIKPEEGIPLPKAVMLLDHMRNLSLHMENKVDPCDVVWNILLQYNVKYENNPAHDFDNDESTVRVDRGGKDRRKRRSNDSETITAAAFLKFLRYQQKSTKATIQQVKDLFERLNSITNASQLMDDGITRKETEVKDSYSKMHITKAVFFNYILSDSNDAFDPSRGQWEQDDMTQPLCSYWINASHDTYLKDVPPSIVDNVFAMNFADCPMSVKMYATALYRGCRCLDVDVWDGTLASKGQAVIKLDSSKFTSSSLQTMATNTAGNNEPILFSDVLWLMRSFILSNPRTLPVILFIENHCSLANQEKMANDISNILADDDMVYIPQGGEAETLPSPDVMRGKVVIKFKIAQDTMSAVFDDHDDDNDINPDKTTKDFFHSDEADIHVQGLETIGSMISDSPHNNQEKTTFELEREAENFAIEARAIADKADGNAFNAKVKSNRAREFAQELLKKANLSIKEAEVELKKLERKAKRSSPSRIAPNAVPWDSTYDASVHSFVSYDDDTMYTNDRTVNTKAGFVEHAREQVGRMLQWGLAPSASSSFDSNDDRFMDESVLSRSSDKETESDDEFLESIDDIRINDDDDTEGSDNDTEGSGRNEWIESTAEFKQYQAAAKKKREKEEATDVTAIQKKVDGINVHKELEGIEVEHFFSSTVDHAILEQKEAETKKIKAAEILSIASDVLKKSQKEFNQVDKDFQKAKERRDKASQELESAKTNAIETKSNVKYTQQEVASLKEVIQNLERKLRTGVLAAETAASEAVASNDRALKAEKRAKRAKAAITSSGKRAKYEAQQETEVAKILASEKRAYKEAMKSTKSCQQRWQSIVDGLDKAKRRIKDIESSPQYRSEQNEVELDNLGEAEGKMSKKLIMKTEEKFALQDKLHKATRDKEETEEKSKIAKKALDDATIEYNKHRKKAASAREEADNTAVLADKQADNVDNEKEAAKMRQEAREKAEAYLQKLEAQLTTARAEYKSAERVNEETMNNAVKSQGKAERTKRNANKLENLEKYVARVEKKRKRLRSAKRAYRNALRVDKQAKQNWNDACNVLNKNADLYYKAKIDANVQESRANAEESLHHKALSAYERYKKLANTAEDSKNHAMQCRTIAAEKTAAYRHAQDYTKKKALIHSISQKLSNMTLLHGVKFRYFESSKALPFNHIHSLSEGKIFQIYESGDDEMYNLNKFNKTHMTRVFPSKQQTLRSQSSNYNPVLAWSLGCQVASMNQQACDAFILVNDGRFRVNGSCGYVLKPESMIERHGGDISRRNNAHANLPRRWRIKILSGNNLPKPSKKAYTGNINPHVKVTLYDGGQYAPPVVHVTETLKKNGFNPIWEEGNGTNFKVRDPSTAVVLFSLWDTNEESGSQDFIAAAAIPISCMRQGYRSIPLFDANHMRCGSHRSSMLFVRIDAK